MKRQEGVRQGRGRNTDYFFRTIVVCISCCRIQISPYNTSCINLHMLLHHDYGPCTKLHQLHDVHDQRLNFNPILAEATHRDIEFERFQNFEFRGSGLGLKGLRLRGLEI